MRTELEDQLPNDLTRYIRLLREDMAHRFEEGMGSVGRLELLLSFDRALELTALLFLAGEDQPETSVSIMRGNDFETERAYSHDSWRFVLWSNRWKGNIKRSLYEHYLIKGNLSDKEQQLLRQHAPGIYRLWLKGLAANQ